MRALTVALDRVGAEFALQHGLHPTDIRALIALLDLERAGEWATPGSLAEPLRLNSASVTALLDRMERANLIARERDPDDRRRVHIRVTDDARTMGEQFFGPLFDRAHVVIDEFSDAEAEVVHRFLVRMIDEVDDLQGGR